MTISGISGKYAPSLISAETVPGIPDPGILQGIPRINNRKWWEGNATLSVLSVASGTVARFVTSSSLFIKLKKQVLVGKVVRQFSYFCCCVTTWRVNNSEQGHLLALYNSTLPVSHRSPHGVGGRGKQDFPLRGLGPQKMGCLGLVPWCLTDSAPRAVCFSKGHYKKLLYENCHSRSFAEQVRV